MASQVAITGVGAVSPLGSGFDEIVSNSSHLTGVRDERDLSVQALGVSASARVSNNSLNGLSAKEQRSIDRASGFALLASRQAWTMSGLGHFSGGRLAVSISSGMGGLQAAQSTLDEIATGNSSVISPLTVPRIMPNSAAVRVSIDRGANGGVFSPVSACSSGLEAIALGARMIRDGEVDVVVAGGTESLFDPRTIAAFSALRALSRSKRSPELASRPFDRDRDGFVMGEGSAIFVLESIEHAKARAAPVLAHVLGSGITSDAHSVVAPEPTGRLQLMAMQKALDASEIAASELFSVYAHATGTRAGDLAEARAIERLLVDSARVPITSPKGLVGHLIGASGPISVLLAIGALQTGGITRMPGFEESDTQTELNFVGPIPLLADRTTRRRAVLVNAFGFGGQNVSLVISASQS